MRNIKEYHLIKKIDFCTFNTSMHLRLNEVYFLIFNIKCILKYFEYLL